MNQAEQFRRLHKPGEPFIMPNAWDVGSAQILEALGAKAIGTSSGAHAFSIGKNDFGEVTRAESLQHTKDMRDALNIPVSGDFENGYGHKPDEVHSTISSAISGGIIAGSIEDIKAPRVEAYTFSDSVARIEAAVDARKSADIDFVITARADGVMYGVYDLSEAIRRLKAFAKAGADVLFAPVPGTMLDLARLCASVDKPVSVICVGEFTNRSLHEFANAGVARVSVGTGLARIAHTALIETASAIFEHGDFAALANAMSGSEIANLLNPRQD